MCDQSKVRLRSRLHTGEINFKKLGLVDCFLLQRAWDKFHAKGLREKWQRTDYEARVLELRTQFNSGLLKAEFHGSMQMPVDVLVIEEPERSQACSCRLPFCPLHAGSLCTRTRLQKQNTCNLCREYADGVRDKFSELCCCGAEESAPCSMCSLHSGKCGRLSMSIQGHGWCDPCTRQRLQDCVTSQMLEIRMVPSKYNDLLSDMLDLTVNGATVTEHLPMNHAKVLDFHWNLVTLLRL